MNFYFIFSNSLNLLTHFITYYFKEMSKDTKKKLEEKTLKSLKELASLPHNRCCCDCGQRGPTYVNITIGSFVCTSCSGILRGLVPPHRVKSINMATFSQDEIEFLRIHGNRYNQLVYMALYDKTSTIKSDTKDIEKQRDFLTLKYENKRWYSPPNESILNQIKRENEQIANFTLKQPTRPTNLQRKDSLVSDKTNSSISGSISSFDQVFKSSQENTSQTLSNTQDTNFANFDLFDQFVNSSSIEQQQQNQQQITHPVVTQNFNRNNNQFSYNQPQSQLDKYSALAELDSIFTPNVNQQQQHQQSFSSNINTPNPFLSQQTLSTASSYFNPFQIPNQYQAPVNITNPFMMTQIQQQPARQAQNSFNPFL